MGVEEGGLEPEAAVRAGTAQDGAACGEEGAADGCGLFVGGRCGPEQDGGEGGAFVQLQVRLLVDQVRELSGGGAGAVDERGQAGAAERPEGDGDLEDVGAAGRPQGAAEQVGQSASVSSSALR